MPLTLKVGSRSSPLAIVQIKEVQALLMKAGISVHWNTKTYATQGDRDKTTPLTALHVADNFFTDTLDKAILDGQIDIAIHSAKDLPRHMAEGLEIFALTKSLDDTDAWVSPYAWDQLPKGARVGTSSLLRQNQILQLRKDIQVVDIRGTIQERLELLKGGHLDGIIVATCALKRLGLEGEIKSILPWEGMPLQGQLAVVGRAKDQANKEIFKTIDVRRYYGQVTLVGAGPGDPELISLKAIKALEKTDCVFYDYLADASLLQYAPNAQHIYVGKRKSQHSLTQKELNQKLKTKAFEGKNIVRLKGGDPLIFGRGAEEINYLQSYHIPVGVIPGISSATGIPSSLGIPLTARGVSSSVAFVSGHEEDEHKPVHIPETDTIIFLMGLTKLKEIVANLTSAGWPSDKPIMIISQGTKTQQDIIQGTLKTIEQKFQESQLKPPALIIAGDVVKLYKPTLSSPNVLIGDPANKTYLHCGTHPQLYTHLGKIVSLPLIEIHPVIFNEDQKKHLLKFWQECQWVLLTSRYATECFVKAMAAMNIDLSQRKFALIGQATARKAKELGLVPQLIAEDETAQGLLDALVRNGDVKGKNFLFPRSSLPNPFLKNELERRGAKVNEVTVYENIKPPKQLLPDVALDGVIFTSPSTVRNFLADYATISSSWKILAKGPVTAQTLKEAGYTCQIVSGD